MCRFGVAVSPFRFQDILSVTFQDVQVFTANKCADIVDKAAPRATWGERVGQSDVGRLGMCTLTCSFMFARRTPLAT